MFLGGTTKQGARKRVKIGGRGVLAKATGCMRKGRDRKGEILLI